VTGASGFLGRRVVDELRARGHEVTVLVRDPGAVARCGWEGRVAVARGDLRRRLDPAALGRAEAVVHLAASLTDPEEQQFAGTVGGTERLLDAVAGSEVRRLVLASSMAVYDWSAAGGLLDESTPMESRLDLRDVYAITKVWQERVVRDRIAGRELVVLRPGYIWGPGRMDNAGIGRAVGSTYLVFGPRRRLPLTYVDNCAAAFVLAAETPGAAGATVNVVDSDDVRAGAYARFLVGASPDLKRTVPVPGLLAKGVNRLGAAAGRVALGRGAALPSLFIPRRYDARFKDLRFPTDAAETRLGWRPRVPFEEALARSGE
jgi:UDP-glucose 4-epimerase